MRKASWVRHLMAGSLLFAFAGLSTAQEVRVGASAKTNQIRRTSVIVGANVRLHGGATGGQVADIVINDHGCIDYVVVMHEQKYIIVPWAAAEVDYDQKYITLGITREKFLEAPSFVGSNWPDLYAADFSTRIRGVFNVNLRDREGVRGEGRIREQNRLDSDRAEQRERSNLDPDRAEQEGNRSEIERRRSEAERSQRESERLEKQGRDERKPDQTQREQSPSREKQPSTPNQAPTEKRPNQSPNQSPSQSPKQSEPK